MHTVKFIKQDHSVIETIENPVHVPRENDFVKLSDGELRKVTHVVTSYENPIDTITLVRTINKADKPFNPFS